jgi:putative DNA primase/helicase
LYEMPYDSVPTATFFMDTNYRPDIPESDDAIWNRIYLIYFKNKVKRIKGEPGFIPDFKDKIVEPIELSGLLNWCIEGYRMWREEGLFQSSGMLDVKQEYREDQDTVLQFINDCISYDENAYVPMNDLYKAYESWCRIQGIETINGRQSRNSLTDVLADSHNWTKKVIRGTNGKSVRAWTGVQFKITPPENSMYREDDEQTFKPYSE